jgi:hypothetical protein
MELFASLTDTDAPAREASGWRALRAAGRLPALSVPTDRMGAW